MFLTIHPLADGTYDVFTDGCWWPFNCDRETLNQLLS